MVRVCCGALPIEQITHALPAQSQDNLLQALSTYEIERIFACSDSAADQGLPLETAVIETKSLSTAEQAELIASQDAVLHA